MVEETLESERPSRSDSRLEETTDDFGAFMGAGETKNNTNTQKRKKPVCVCVFSFGHWMEPQRRLFKILVTEALKVSYCRK